MNKPGSFGYYEKKMKEVSKASKPKKPVAALPEPEDVPIVEEEPSEIIDTPDYDPVVVPQPMEKKVPWVLLGVVGLGLILAFSSEK